MNALVFVDANVLLYADDSSEPARQPRARAWLERLWRERSGRTSVQVLSEYYYNVTRKLKPGLAPELAWEYASAYRSWNPQSIDMDVAFRAREVERRHRLSWWDSLVVAAAQAQHCSILLTEDLHDGARYGDVTVRSPFTLSAEEPHGEYVLARAEPVHRARGRPARRLSSRL